MKPLTLLLTALFTGCLACNAVAQTSVTTRPSAGSAKSHPRHHVKKHQVKRHHARRMRSRTVHTAPVISPAPPASGVTPAPGTMPAPTPGASTVPDTNPTLPPGGEAIGPRGSGMPGSQSPGGIGVGAGMP